MTLAQRLVGVALALVALLPLHRFLDPGRTGPAGAATRDTAEFAWVLGLAGTFIVLTLAWVAMRMRPRSGVFARVLHRAWEAVLRPAPGAFAAAVGVAATLGAGTVASLVHGRSPTTVDEMAQLLHAALVANGRLTLPTGDAAAAWMIQNGVMAGDEWASIYPPFHTLLLAAGVAGGAAWLVGPIMTGVATGASTWVMERTAGGASGRLAGLLLCVSPFWLLVGGSHLSHTTAAAALALLAACCLAARDATTNSRGLLWALGAGAAAGAAISARPWVGLVCGAAIVATVWGPQLMRQDRRRSWPARFVAVGLGGAPFAALLFWWNSALFGHPFRLGYSVAFGPSHGLGLHVDPWGNRYGGLESLAYTGADLLQLGVRLLESPVPATLLVAGALVLVPGAVSHRMRLPGLWAGSVVAANALYWHHGIHFGPRMLYESVPAWMGLVGIAATAAFDAGDGSGARFARWVVGMTLTAGLVLSLSTLTSVVGTRAPAQNPLAFLEGQGARTVFVHGSWASRVSARLAASGMRRDSIETALRRNDLCQVDRYARWRSAPTGSPPALDFDPRPGSPPGLQVRTLSPGNRIRVSPDVRPDATCRREARADRLGVLELELMAWRGPAVADSDVVFARDLGPGANLRVLRDRADEALVWIERAEDGPLILPYPEAMQLLWGGPGD